MKVISGGQTGCDQAALRAARACGIETGGTAPKGWLTEEGPAPWLADYGLVEHESSDWAPRTRANVKDADAVLLIGDPNSRGSICTLKAAIRFNKPALILSKKFAGQTILVFEGSKDREFLVYDADPQIVVPWLLYDEYHTANVAGNRESSNPGIGAAAEAFLTDVFRAWKEQAK